VTHGLHLGHENRPRALGVIAAAVLIATLVVTGRVQSGTERRPSIHADGFDATAAPYRIGGRVACPPGRPVLARSEGSSYPPGHPARSPRDADPVACYETAEQATAAGYAPAPLPAGALEVGGVFLVPASSRLRRQCRPAADRLGFAVPCPTLLPPPSPNAAPPTLCDPRFLCGPEVGFLFEEDGFMVPRGYVGVDGQPRGRLAVAAAEQVTAFPVACLGGRTVARIQVHGTQGGLIECPSEAGAHFGSVLLRWRERGVVMAVSLHGHTELNRRLVMALAAHMELVLPSDPPGSPVGRSGRGGRTAGSPWP
jgi:hypothetical protein